MLTANFVIYTFILRFTCQWRGTGDHSLYGRLPWKNGFGHL